MKKRPPAPSPQVPANLAARIVRTSAFRGAVLAAILAGAIIVGLETIPEVEGTLGGFLATIDATVLALFVIEVILKIAAEGRRPWRYFLDPWNVFDFAVTAVCLLPVHAEYAQVLRLGRVARSLRMVTALPRLQLIVGALLRSLPSFGWITLLLFMLLYSFSVMGVFLFGGNDPDRFGSLWLSMLTMFGPSSGSAMPFMVTPWVRGYSPVSMVERAGMHSVFCVQARRYTSPCAASESTIGVAAIVPPLQPSAS